MFINPMWDNEAQRVGLQRCTPIGYFIHGISDLIGLAGLIIFVVSLITILYRVIIGTFHLGLFWYLAAGLGFAVLRFMVSAITWTLASRRGFAYDSETRTASWIDHGKTRTLHYSDIVRENR